MMHVYSSQPCAKKLAIFFVVLEAKRVSYALSSKHGFYNKYFGQF
jgi:hypothetical protein